MADQTKYHTAIEIKSITAFFIRRMKEIEKYVESNDDKDLQDMFLETENKCIELYEFSSKRAEEERPPEIMLSDPDRGINDFLEIFSCGSCGGNCGNCGGGNGTP